MLIIIVVNIIIYCTYGWATYYCFANITPFSFTVLLYIAPLIINIFFSAIYIKKNKKMMGKFVSPILSIINYVILGFVLQVNGLWDNFVTRYTVDTAEVSISIASSMITLSQIVFIMLLYFGINYLFTTIFIKKGVKNEYIKNYESV